MPPSTRRARRAQVTVWEWKGEALDEGNEAAAYLTAFMGFPVRLVRYSGREDGAAAGPAVRACDPQFAPAGDEARMHDGFPVLVASEASLVDLNRQLAAGGAAAVPMTRFRANVIVAGAAGPWEEDTWAEVAVGAAGAARLAPCKPCSRCKVTTIDQLTGAETGDEPLGALGETRSGKVLGWAAVSKAWTHAVFFAWNATVLSPGLLTVGDSLKTTPWAADHPFVASRVGITR
jgi:uncharacterized protein YcbX